MIPEYIHFNESCIIDPMLLSLMNNNKDNNSSSSHSQTPTPSASTTDKTTQRNSIISQYSTTTSGSTFRDSFASSDGTNEYEELQARHWSAEQSSLGHVRSERPPSTSFSSSSLQPSSRYLLSGATSSETFRQQELQRFYPIHSIPPPLSLIPSSSSVPPSSSRRIKALSDPFVKMPSIALVTQPIEIKPAHHQYHPHHHQHNKNISSTIHFNDPWTMTVNLALDNAICQDWLYKYESPTFAFSRSWKRRYTVLYDKTLYIFKSNNNNNNSKKNNNNTSSSPPSDRFLLTDDTLVFVTEEFKKGCVIEIRKPLCKWYLRCESITQMKIWLETLKKVVACIKLNYQTPLTSKLLSNLSLTDDSRLLVSKSSLSSPMNPSPSYYSQQQQHQRSQSQRMLPISKRLLNYSKKRNSTPPLSLQQQQHQILASSSSSSTYSINHNNTPKRQSLAQIPHWKKTLPPQLPPPTSLPPPPPSSPSSPSSSPFMTRSFSMGSPPSSSSPLLFKKHSNESLKPIQLPTVNEIIGDPIDSSSFK